MEPMDPIDALDQLTAADVAARLTTLLSDRERLVEELDARIAKLKKLQRMLFGAPARRQSGTRSGPQQRGAATETVLAALRELGVATREQLVQRTGMAPLGVAAVLMHAAKANLCVKDDQTQQWSLLES